MFSKGRKVLAISVGVAASFATLQFGPKFQNFAPSQWKYTNSKVLFAEHGASLDHFGAPRDDLPTFSLEEVQKHNSFETGIWVTFKNGVYDVTEFVNIHPGGFDKIKLAFGASVDPFWEIYGQHRVFHVLELLEQFRIGNLSPEDVKETDGSLDPYKNDPRRHNALVVRSEKPFNAERLFLRSGG